MNQSQTTITPTIKRGRPQLQKPSKKLSLKGSPVPKIFKKLLDATFQTNSRGEEIVSPELWEVEAENLHFIKSLDFNRPKDLSHCDNMADSVGKLKSILRLPIVFKIDKEFWMADGQHLKAALEKDGLDMRFYMLYADTKKDIMVTMTTMNSTSRNWSLKQFVESWCTFNEDYKLLKSFAKDYGLTYTTLGMLLTNNTMGNVKKLIASGNFKVSNLKEATHKINLIDSFYFNTEMINYQYCTVALICFMKDHDISKVSFLNNVKNNNNRIAWGRKDDYINFFINCYK
jgi:hypothetical protein